MAVFRTTTPYLLGILLAVLGAVIAPLLFPGSPSENFSVITDQSELDEHLKSFEESLGGDFDGYRNHCLRVLTYAVHFLKEGSGFDASEVSIALPVLGAALAYHDIGLWADGELYYIEESAERAKEALQDKFSVQQISTIHNIIMEHHKITPWHGEDEALVNAVRKADWVDATMGFVRYGMPTGNIATTRNALEESSFHETLMGMFNRLKPGSYNLPNPKSIVEFFGIFRY
ncbi:hypothetical protein NDN08_005763 [Rhodosorus marinus]|uniref:HD domain-containing protein n=1 Tax=Rhodosorus marinus TaxID=101924 RepID=A0AAV8V2I4_9RHOD|nr:hypothetical protein NDN08_005763 [Rhodosorus marinus]